MIHEHPLTEPVYEQLTARGIALPLPRDYGLRLVSEILHTADHLRAHEQQSTKESQP